MRKYINSFFNPKTTINHEKVSLLNLMLIPLILFVFPDTGFTQTQTAQFYNVVPGVGNGLRFWNSNSYKIHMGNTTAYKYGPVTGFSVKMTMNNQNDRGWTWGKVNQAPIAAMNAEGKFQTASWMRSMARRYYFGNVQNLYGDNSSRLYWQSNHSTVTSMELRDKENTRYGLLYGSGNGVNFGLLDGDGNWSILAVKDNYTAFRINNSEKMRINNNGNVGIGTNVPTYKLSVNNGL